MRNNDTFQGNIKTKRGRFEFLNELRAVWFADGERNYYKIVKEKIGNKWFFLLLRECDSSPDKSIFSIEIE